jgi:hypothetical protein
LYHCNVIPVESPLMDSQPDSRLDPCDGGLDSGTEGQPIAGSGRIAPGEQHREETAGWRL